MSTYLDVVKEVYATAAQQPDAGLCCTAFPAWTLPGLQIPQRMLEMNYGCGSAVDPCDIRPDDNVLYIGVGGGLEALQLAYLLRRPGAVIAVDAVAEMRQRAADNFTEAARLNPWFRPKFVQICAGNALALPAADRSVTVVAQNCLFNVFQELELRTALAEVFRVLQPGGRFFTTDPITTEPLPAALQTDDRLRARCISGCPTLERYLELLTDAGFGCVEVRARFPYRVLGPSEYPMLERPILLESIEVAAYKEPPPVWGPAIFIGRTATYIGLEAVLDLGEGRSLVRGVPIPISEAAARELGCREDVFITAPTYHARGRGCC